VRFGKWKSGPAWVHVRGGFYLADLPQKVEQGCVCRSTRAKPHAVRTVALDAEVRNGHTLLCKPGRKGFAGRGE
jgi:hypothetical protein